MEWKIIYQNEFACIFVKNSIVMIETYKKGIMIEHINEILSAHEGIEITDRAILENALKNAPVTESKIGKLKERIIINVSKDDMLADIVFHLSEQELEMDKRGELLKETYVKLREKNIIFGLKGEIFTKEIIPGVTYTIAEGKKAENGVDCIITMYEIVENKPVAREDEKVDFYQHSLITTVPENTWLGERIEATNGIMGKTIKGVEIKAVDGRNLPLQYDKSKIREEQEENKTVLYSNEYGAIYYKNDGSISLMNPLVVDGDVDFKTGNIDFDGFVIVKGTVCDGFYVKATKDIEINGELGIGNVKGVISTGGSISIKGGILSKGTTEINAAKNVYTKFVDNASITCGGTVHIGFYSSNSTIQAKEVIIDAFKGQIIGGTVKVETRVISPYIGSELGKKVSITVTGFDKEAVKKEIETIATQNNSLKREYEDKKQSVTHLSAQAQLSTFQYKLLDENKKRLLAIRNDIKELSDHRRSLECYINTRGDGEVRAVNKIYPNCSIMIKKCSMEVSTPMLGVTFFVQGGKLIEI